MERLSALSRSITGSVALVTGAGSGMGRATAHLFADEGAKIALVDVNAEALEQVAQEIHGVEGEALVLPCDCSVQADIETAIGATAEHYGGLDILVNNAGFAVPTGIEAEQYDAVWEKSLAVMVNAQQWEPAWVPSAFRRVAQHIEPSSTCSHGKAPQRRAGVRLLDLA